MREMTFRGKSLGSRKWYTGSYIPPISEHNQAHICYTEPNGSFCVLVDPDTVGQYTGFNDSYGLEIYEGDIIEYTVTSCNLSYRCRIEFLEGAFYAVGLDSDNDLYELRDLITDHPVVEVIGNIHDGIQKNNTGCNTVSIHEVTLGDDELEMLEAYHEERVLVLPCPLGTIMYEVVDDCEFGTDCGTKRKCVGCEYRYLHIEKSIFNLSKCYNDGSLLANHYLTKEEAESALEKLKQGCE